VNEKGQETVIKMICHLKWEKIILKRGISSSMDIWDRRKQVEDEDVEEARRNDSIFIYNKRHKEAARWNFERA
jgi:phage tail-like protein